MITFYDQVELVLHIVRRIARFKIDDDELEKKVYEDFGLMLRREFGLSDMNSRLTKVELAIAHEVVDSYEPPYYLQELINAKS